MSKLHKGTSKVTLWLFFDFANRQFIFSVIFLNRDSSNLCRLCQQSAKLTRILLFGKSNSVNRVWIESGSNQGFF